MAWLPVSEEAGQWREGERGRDIVAALIDLPTSFTVSVVVSRLKKLI